MTTAMTPSVEASLEAVVEQVRSLATRHDRSRTVGARVRVHRVVKPKPYWRITARITRPQPRDIRLWFAPREIRFGKDRIVMPDTDQLMIISAGWSNETLTLCLAETARAAKGADRSIGAASELGLVADTRDQMNEPARRVAATRALRAVSRAIAHSPIRVLAEAASAPTDMEVLILALQQPEAIESVALEDPLAPARIRGLRAREKLLTAEGGTLSAEDVADHLRITRQAVNKRRQHGALVGLDAGRHGYLYPAWQFVRNGTISGLDAVLDAVKTHDPWMQHIFMTSGNTRLAEASPLERLRDGRLEDVLNAARAFGEHGAA